MNKVLILSLFFIKLTSLHATPHAKSDTFDMDIDLVTSISVSVGDVTINNVVGGDTIDKDLTVTLIKDADRSATCSLSSGTLTLTSVGETDIQLTASINGACNTLSIDGTVPTLAGNGKTFSGNVSVDAAYDLTTY